jgi:hypothetical protein
LTKKIKCIIPQKRHMTALIGQVVAAQHVLAAADIPSLKKNVQ